MYIIQLCHVNPIALRKTKIVCNFSLSEYSRVKKCFIICADDEVLSVSLYLNQSMSQS